MGVNDDRLSEREHGEMRDILLAGTQRIRPAGAHRAQLIAGAVALVLIGGITGGAVTTAALLNAGDDIGPISTPTQTADPSPSATAPTPTPTLEPSAPVSPPEGTVPFGGDCANTLSDAEVEAITGIPMARSDYEWETGANAVLGGIDCVWVSEGVYLAATTHLFAFPVSVVPSPVREIATGCVPVGSETTDVECTSTAVVDGTWMLVRTTGAVEEVTAAGVDQLLADASGRLAEFPPPTPATRAATWWGLPDCAELVSRIDPAMYGYERVALAEQQSATWYSDDRPEGIALFAGATFWCDLHFTSGSGDSTTGEVVSVSVVPGGAITFQTALDARDAQTVTVDGAQAAVVVPGLDRYEGSPAVLVVTDGVNMLMLTPDMISNAADAAPLAAVLLPLVQQ